MYSAPTYRITFESDWCDRAADHFEAVTLRSSFSPGIVRQGRITNVRRRESRREILPPSCSLIHRSKNGALVR